MPKEKLLKRVASRRHERERLETQAKKEKTQKYVILAETDLGLNLLQ